MLARSLNVSALVLVLAFLAVYPLSMLLYGSLHSTPPGMAGKFNLDGYRALLDWRVAKLFINTVGISLVKTLLALGLAVALAWIVARTDTPCSRLLETLITLPFFLPPILTAMAWSMLGNPQVGSLNLLINWITGSNLSPIDVYSYGGMIWYMLQFSTSVTFILIVDAFRAMDPALEEASRISGASMNGTFFRVTLFLMLPVLTNTFLLSFMRGLEDFEAPLFFGLPAGIRVITTEIYNAITYQVDPRYQYATALGFALMVFMLLLVLAQRAFLGKRSYHTVTGKGYSPGVIRLGRWRWITFGFCMLFSLVTVILPVGQIIAGSFFKFVGFYDISSLTLEHYRHVFNNSLFWRAIGNTLLLGLLGATATMILGALVAYVTTRTHWFGKRLIESLAWLTWMFPGIVLGVGFLWGYAFLPGPIQIYGTIWALFLAYVALGTPLSVRVMSGIYSQLSHDIEECSRVHGATWWQTLWRILIALAWPAFAVGWVLTFVGIVRELSASILLYSVGTEVLSVVMLKLWTNGKAEEVSVIGVFMLALVALFLVVQRQFVQRRVSIL